MKLSECTHGKLVTDGNRVGMVIGITTSALTEEIEYREEIERAVPLIQWSSG